MVGWHHQLNGQNLSKLWKTVKGGKSGMLQSMGSQRVRHNIVTEQQQRKTQNHHEPFNKFIGTCIWIVVTGTIFF